MELLVSSVTGVLNGIGPFLILLGLLIFVHELGHFLVAKFFGVRVEVFSLGFGKKIFQYKKGDTNYCISIIPLGGYVKMFGDDPSASVSGEQRQYSFLHKPVGPRIAIVLAGPLMNLLFAFFLFIVIGLAGEPLPSPQIGDVAAGTRAFEAGFRSGDTILKIDETPIETWPAAREIIENSANRKLTFWVERGASTERAEIHVTPVLGPNENILSRRDQVGGIEGLETSSLAPVIGVMGPETDAAKAGLKSFDMILTINDREVGSWRDLERMIQEEVQRGRNPLRLSVQSYLDEKSNPRIVEFNVPAAKEKGADNHSQQVDDLVVAKPMNELGIESSQLYLWKIKASSPAAQAGLGSGDRVVAVNGKPIQEWTQVIDYVRDYNPDGKPIEFRYRRDGEEKTVELVPEMSHLMTAQGKDEQRYTVGIVSGFIQVGPKPIIYRSKGFVELMRGAVERTWNSTGMVIMSVVRLINGDVSAKNVGGIISIGRFANQSFAAGFAAFVKMMALISINLFLLNLLPVPVLDGGHLVFFSIEALRGAPLSMRKMEIAQQVGLVILMSLMAFALFNDISNWLNAW